jgi:hypothetical protein
MTSGECFENKWFYMKYLGKYLHCRQRAPIENAWSTSGYFKAVFLKKTQIIIVSIYEYTVYIMF